MWDNLSKKSDAERRGNSEIREESNQFPQESLGCPLI